MSNGFDEIFCCPECGSRLKRSEKGFKCKCGFTAPLKDGYFDFIGKPSPYWGEISEKEMKKVNEEVSKHGEEHLKAFLEKNFPERIPYFYNPVRIGFIYNIQKNKFNRVLDLGSGWGSLSFMLAKFAKKVYSVESVEERIKFQSYIKKIRKVDNLHLIRGNVNNLMFCNSSFDLIIVNGLLEWVGLFAESYKEARRMQVEFLKKLKELLTEDGVLYIGIENRIGMQYWLGTKDHNGLRFNSLLPRPIANIYSKLLKNEPYTTLTYSQIGYSKILKEAGFEDFEFYWAFPSYNFPKFSGPMEKECFISFLEYIKNNPNEARVWEKEADIEKSKPNKKALMLSKLPKFVKGNLVHFAPAFQIFAYKKNKKGRAKQPKIFRVASENKMKSDVHEC